MAILEGWERLPGTANRYIAPTGENVSRRTYLNVLSQESGWASYTQYSKAAKLPMYKEYLTQAKEVDEDARKIGSEFSRAWASVENDPKARKGQGFRNSSFWPDLLEASGVSEDKDLELWRQSEELRKQRQHSTLQRSYRTRKKR